MRVPPRHWSVTQGLVSAMAEPATGTGLADVRCMARRFPEGFARCFCPSARTRTVVHGGSPGRNIPPRPGEPLLGRVGSLFSWRCWRRLVDEGRDGGDDLGRGERLLDHEAVRHALRT